MREKSCVHNPTSRAATRVQPRKEEPSKPLHWKSSGSSHTDTAIRCIIWLV